MLTELPEDEEEGDPMIGVESKKSSVSLEDEDDGEAGDLMVGVELTKSMVSSEDDGGEPGIGEPMIGIESTKSSVSLEDEGEGDPVASKQSSLDSDSSKRTTSFEPRRSPRNRDPMVSEGDDQIVMASTNSSSVPTEDIDETDPMIVVESNQSSLDSDSSKPIIPFEPRRSPRNHDPTTQLILPLDVTPRLSSKKKKPVFTKGGIVLDVNN
jgi:hypothetical protein